MRDEPGRCVATAVPPDMSAWLEGYNWTQNLKGQSGGAVYRLQGRPDASDLFLKHGRGSVAADILDEMERLHWMAGHLPVPTVRHFVYTGDEAWLLTTALPGNTAYDLLRAYPDGRLAIVDKLAAFLRRLHGIPVSKCPFNSGYDYRLVQGRERIEAGLVDEDDFDEAREGWTAEQVWEALRRFLPFTPDSVVTHGDFSLDNLLFHEGEVAGCIDVGRAGIADRYQDLAVIWNSLGEFGDALQNRLLAGYGIAQLEHDKLQFHLTLDELF